jgi:uncharacterized protein YbaA (DUF1428 family)
MSYVDAYVAAVPTANREAFHEQAVQMGAVFKENGALATTDCWGDDVPDGKVTSFPLAVKKEPDEAVVFGWVVWPSKAVRDAGMAKVMADPRMQPGASPMPFDGKRMIYGGFDPIVEL